MLAKPISIILLFFLVTAGMSADGFPLSNKAVVDSLTLEILSGPLSRSEMDSLALDPALLNAEKAGYLRFLVGKITDQNRIHFLRNYTTDGSFEGKVLVVNEFDVQIKYSEPFEKSFFGRKFVNRHIVVSTNGQIYGAQSEVVYQTINRSIQAVDEISETEIGSLEESGYSFSRGTRAGYSFWEKIYEPVLAVTSVAVIVYLFFIQRT